MDHGNAMIGAESRTRRPCLRLSAAVALLVALGACGGNPTEPDPNPFLRQFDTFWTAFDRNYSYFVYKNINWDSLRTVYRPQAGAVQTQAALIDVMRAMVSPMRD